VEEQRHNSCCSPTWTLTIQPWPLCLASYSWGHDEVEKPVYRYENDDPLFVVVGV
jgi:hypothetical protein